MGPPESPMEALMTYHYKLLQIHRSTVFSQEDLGSENTE
jgi:hypothetical protein